MAVPLQTRIRDVGYATLGVGDVAAEVARNLTRIPVELPDRIRGFRTEAPDAIQKRFDELTDRGRQVADRFGRLPVVETASERVGEVTTKAKAKVPTAAKTSRSTSSTPYENRTLDELQELAAAHDIEGRSTMKKAELIEALRAAS